MFKSFIVVFGSLFFSIFLLFLSQLDWRGETLEMHFSSWVRGASVTRLVQKTSKTLQVKVDKKFVELKHHWAKDRKKKSHQLRQKVDNFVQKKDIGFLSNREDFIEDKSNFKNSADNKDRLKQLTKSVQKKFKRSLSNSKK